MQRLYGDDDASAAVDPSGHRPTWARSEAPPADSRADSRPHERSRTRTDARHREPPDTKRRRTPADALNAPSKQRVGGSIPPRGARPTERFPRLVDRRTAVAGRPPHPDRSGRGGRRSATLSACVRAAQPIRLPRPARGPTETALAVRRVACPDPVCPTPVWAHVLADLREGDWIVLAAMPGERRSRPAREASRGPAGHTPGRDRIRPSRRAILSDICQIMPNL